MRCAESDAFILGADPLPDWFMDLVTTNQVILRGEDWGPIQSCDIQGLGNKLRGQVIMRQEMPEPGQPFRYPPEWLASISSANN